jgi:hypothetical protein
MAVDTEGRRNVQEAGELRVNCCRSIIQSRGKGCFSTYADSYVNILVIMKSRRWISTSARTTIRVDTNTSAVRAEGKAKLIRGNLDNGM